MKLKQEKRKKQGKLAILRDPRKKKKLYSSLAKYQKLNYITAGLLRLFIPFVATYFLSLPSLHHELFNF